jgi:hypothetical protein
MHQIMYNAKYQRMLAKNIAAVHCEKTSTWIQIRAAEFYTKKFVLRKIKIKSK